MSRSLGERIKAARAHALAVLKDRGKIILESSGERIPNKTYVTLLGITYPNGKKIEKSYDRALLHWHETGFGTYAPALRNPGKKALAASDKALMASAIAETMKVRRTYRGKEGECK